VPCWSEKEGRVKTSEGPKIWLRKDGKCSREKKEEDCLKHRGKKQRGKRFPLGVGKEKGVRDVRLTISHHHTQNARKRAALPVTPKKKSLFLSTQEPERRGRGEGAEGGVR